MTQKEFETLTGNTSFTPEQYEKIERCYMAAGDNITKEQFCTDVKYIGLVPTLLAMTERIERAEALLKEKKALFDKLAVFIAEQAEYHRGDDLRERAVKMMGESAYIEWKLKSGDDLWEEDKELIVKLLNHK